MSKNNIYLNGAVHLDHSNNLEINQQNLSAEDLNRIIHTFMHGNAPGHTEKPASSPMPVYAEEVVCETDGQQEAEALAQARQAQEQARQAQASLSLAGWLKELIDELHQEGLLKRKYDYTWVMWGVNRAAGRKLFANSRSFLNYLSDGGIDALPSLATLQAHDQGFSLHKRPDEWTFQDSQDEQERQRRIHVGKFSIRFLRDKGLIDKLL